MLLQQLQKIVKNKMSKINNSKWNEYQVKIEEGIYQKIQRFKSIEWLDIFMILYIFKMENSNIFEKIKKALILVFSKE